MIESVASISFPSLDATAVSLENRNSYKAYESVDVSRGCTFCLLIISELLFKAREPAMSRMKERCTQLRAHFRRTRIVQSAYRLTFPCRLSSVLALYYVPKFQSHTNLRQKQLTGSTRCQLSLGMSPLFSLNFIECGRRMML